MFSRNIQIFWHFFYVFDEITLIIYEYQILAVKIIIFSIRL